MAKKKSTVKKAPRAKRKPPAVKIEQRNPFCSKTLGELAELDLSTTIDMVKDGLVFLAEMEPPSEYTMSEEAECGRTHFIETLCAALDYAQNVRHQLEQKRSEVTSHG